MGKDEEDYISDEEDYDSSSSTDVSILQSGGARQDEFAVDLHGEFQQLDGLDYFAIANNDGLTMVSQQPKLVESVQVDLFLFIQEAPLKIEDHTVIHWMEIFYEQGDWSLDPLTTYTDQL